MAQEQSFGKLLKRKVDGRTPDAGIKSGRSAESPFLNPARRRIYEFFCRYPCASPTQASVSLDMTLSTLRWHLDKLIQAGYLSGAHLGRKLGIYSAALVPVEYCNQLIVLNGNMERTIMAFILKKNGCSQSEIIKEIDEPQQNVQSYLKKLEEHDLVEILKDGRFRRYYPGELLSELEKRVQERAKNFKADFLEKTRGRGIKPRVSIFSRQRMVVELTSGKETSAMVIPFTPIASILSRNRSGNRRNGRKTTEEDVELIGKVLLKMMGRKRERT